MLPYILSGFSIIIAFIFHWQYPQRFWYATALTTIATLLVSLLAIYLVQSSYLGITNNQTTTPILIAFWLSVLICFFGFLVGAFVGYFLKVIKS